MNDNCLARPLETQASDSTGFRSFKQFIVEWDQSKSAYDKIVVEDPSVVLNSLLLNGISLNRLMTRS